MKEETKVIVGIWCLLFGGAFNLLVCGLSTDEILSGLSLGCAILCLWVAYEDVAQKLPTHTFQFWKDSEEECKTN